MNDLHAPRERGLARRCRPGEVAEVAEPLRPGRPLDGLIEVRRQRQQRLERERGEALRHWRAARFNLGEAKRALRARRSSAVAFWMQARADFFSMRSNSLEFRVAKNAYLGLTQLVEKDLLAWREARAAAGRAGDAFFAARRDASLARMRQEKLQLLREEMTLAQRLDGN